MRYRRVFVFFTVVTEHWRPLFGSVGASSLAVARGTPRFAAANLNIHLHCLVLDGVYHTTEGLPVFDAARPPTPQELQALLLCIIERLMKLLTRRGFLIEEQGCATSPTPIQISRSDPYKTHGGHRRRWPPWIEERL
ncbi:MAG: hypothetical protein ACREA0_20365 [bacterium]